MFFRFFLSLFFTFNINLTLRISDFIFFLLINNHWFLLLCASYRWSLCAPLSFIFFKMLFKMINNFWSLTRMISSTFYWLLKWWLNHLSTTNSFISMMKINCIHLFQIFLFNIIFGWNIWSWWLWGKISCTF